jgi:hypothetical protein
MTQRGKYGTSIPELLRRAKETGTVQAHLDLGVAVMIKKANTKDRSGSWYVARRIERDGRKITQLLGDGFKEDQVHRPWVETRGEALPPMEYRDALRLSATQGQGAPMHEREASRCVPAGDTVTIGAQGIEL